MLKIFTFFSDFLEKHGSSIKHAGIEQLFFTKFNQKNAEFVYGIRGALILLLKQHNISFTEYTPIELKKRITGNGKAQKILVQTMIMKIF